MDTETLINVWTEIGAMGTLALLFGFMITNIIRSQNAQNETLDKLEVDQAKLEETQNNVEGILLKLLARMDKSDDKLDRKIDDLKRSLSDIDNQVSRIEGSLSRLNGRH